MLDPAATDQQLVERARRGDQAAFNALVMKYQSRLLKLVSCIVHDRSDAQDVVQNAFLSACRGLSHFRGDASFYTWLSCIATNSAKSMLQRRKHSFSTYYAQAEPDDENGVYPPERIEANTPENLLECREIAAIAALAVSQMRIELTLALTLHEVHGLSYEQIAAVMQSPVGTVRGRIHDARAHIAKRIAAATALPLPCKRTG